MQYWCKHIIFIDTGILWTEYIATYVEWQATSLRACGFVDYTMIKLALSDQRKRSAYFLQMLFLLLNGKVLNIRE